MNVDRRQLIKTGLLGFVAVISGCISSGNGTETITSIEPNNDGKFSLGEFRHFLENPTVDIQAVVVDDFTMSDGELYLSYESSNHIMQEIIWIGTMYADYVGNNENPPSRLNVTVLDSFGEKASEFYIKQDWAQRYSEKKVTETQFLLKIKETLQVTD